MVEDRGGTGIETLDGAAHLEEVLVVIGAENRIPLHLRLEVGDAAVVSDGEGTGTRTVTRITGGYHRLDGIAILRLPVAVHVVDGTVEEAGEGRETRDLAARPAETPGMTEHTTQIGMLTWGRLL